MGAFGAEPAKSGMGGTLANMFFTNINSAALRAFGQPRALIERISFAVQPMVSPAQAGSGAGAFTGGRSSHRST
jgi:hypothetical protein